MNTFEEWFETFMKEQECFCCDHEVAFVYYNGSKNENKKFILVKEALKIAWDEGRKAR